jgi:branched-chain amino acid transport system substrate-binding protein
MGAEVPLRMFVGTALALLLALVATSCGGEKQQTIRIGIFNDCRGPFSGDYQRSMAGAELPFVRRGAKLLGSKPSDGVGAVSVAGRRVELILGCHYLGSFVRTFAEARRLVEQEDVRVLVTPFTTPDDTILREYARRHRSVAFLSRGLSPLTTLVDPGPNFFRFNSDTAQGMAGLGAYAYHTLGWRTAATLSDEGLGYDNVAGFVAEFCSLGGTVVKRLWAPWGNPGSVIDWSPLVRQIPPGVDGVALLSGLQGTASFFAAYKKLHRDPSRSVVMSAYTFALGERPAGVVAAGYLPFESSAPAWRRYIRDIRAAFPALRNETGLGYDIHAYRPVEAALEALEQVGGDLSGGGRRFMASLAKLHLRGPGGTVRLDANHQAVGPNFLFRVEKEPGGRLVPRTIRVIPNVEQTFNGYFDASSPPTSRTQPVCRKGNPPAWAR